MAFKGDPLLKRVIQASLKPLGYKIVRAKAYDARNARTERSPRASRKVFCIGFNKTGTTSLERVLVDWGIRMPKQLEQEDILSSVISKGDFATLQAFCNDYDAFQDLPFSQSDTYVACDALFPGSRFILTTRDVESWVTSYMSFYKKEFGLEEQSTFSEETFRDRTLYLKSGYVYDVLSKLLVENQGGRPVIRWDLAFDRDFLIEIYLRRTARIRAHFADRPDDFLELNLQEETDTGRLMRFLQIDGQSIGSFPRENVNVW